MKAYYQIKAAVNKEVILSKKYLIGEFSELSGVSKRMLRHYDSLQILEPSETDYKNGYRYYTRSQLKRISEIKILQSIGLTLEQVKLVLDRKINRDEFLDILLERETELRLIINDLKNGEVLVKRLIDSLRKKNSPSLPILDLVNTNLIPKNNMERDKVEKVLNHEQFSEQVEKLLKDNKNETFYYACFDIDNFAKINVEYGFDFGDKVIFFVLKTIEETFNNFILSGNCLIGRLGGDEIGLIIININEDDVIKTIRKSIESVSILEFPELSNNERVTISSGIYKNNSYEHIAELLHLATKELLNAKRSGKNCYSINK